MTKRFANTDRDTERILHNLPGGSRSDMTTRSADARLAPTIGILGGTGDQGRGLARRFAMAGLTVCIGSRTKARAEEAAVAVGFGVTGLDNAECVRRSELVIVAVPWEGHHDLLESLADDLNGRVLVDCVNPLGFDRQGAYALHVDEGSAAQQAALLVPGARVVAAFHNVSAVLLLDPEIESIDTDVLVLGDDREATDLVQDLADRIPGMRGIYGGRLRNAHQVEALTANLISVNRRYKAHAGLRITDV